jgi:death on curing protein
MRYLTMDEVLELHRLVLAQSGGLQGVRDFNAIDSAVAQPAMTFGGQDLHPTLADKAASLGFSLIQNHPFVDGNKRVGQAAMESFLVLNGYELDASIDEQEKIILEVAAGHLGQPPFTDWVRAHTVASKQP